MEAPVEKRPIAWQPLTLRGAAAFAHATTRRLLLVQFLMAVLAASAVAWALHAAWYPVISQAIAGLPAHGAIRAGQLDWRGESTQSLAAGRSLAVAVDLDHAGAAHSPADVEVEFGRSDVRIGSLFGYVRMPYPNEREIPFNKVDLAPWWGAWAPPILAIAMAAVIIGLMLAWALLATLYFVPVWLIGFFANRELDWRGSWRLAGAVLMPGAVFLSAAAVGYGFGALDLIRLLAATAVHFVIGWVYAATAPLRLPRNPALAVAPKNPFGDDKSK
jgi:hypothetical protein